MATKDTVLETMKQAGTPLNAGKIAELSGLDRKEVDKAMKELKAEGAIVSPVRCNGNLRRSKPPFDTNKTSLNTSQRCINEVLLSYCLSLGNVMQILLVYIFPLITAQE